jgi:hypothetical protein
MSIFFPELLTGILGKRTNFWLRMVQVETLRTPARTVPLQFCPVIVLSAFKSHIRIQEIKLHYVFKHGLDIMDRSQNTSVWEIV